MLHRPRGIHVVIMGIGQHSSAIAIQRNYTIICNVFLAPCERKQSFWLVIKKRKRLTLHPKICIDISFELLPVFCFLFCRNCVILWPLSACNVVVLPWSFSLLEDKIPFSCQIIWNHTPYQICPHHNGNRGTFTTSPACDCDFCCCNKRFSWFWSDQISPNLMFWIGKWCYILLLCPTYQHSFGYWNSPAHHNILDHSQGNSVYTKYNESHIWVATVFHLQLTKLQQMKSGAYECHQMSVQLLYIITITSAVKFYRCKKEAV